MRPNRALVAGRLSRISKRSESVRPWMLDLAARGGGQERANAPNQSDDAVVPDAAELLGLPIERVERTLGDAEIGAM